MTTQDWINEQKIEAVQDRKDGKDYWKTDNLYTESDLIELIEAFALYNVVGQSEQLTQIHGLIKCECGKVYDVDLEKQCSECGN